MSALRRLARRLLTFVRRSRAEDELAREVTAHLALIEDEYRRRGVPAEEARLAARRAFGQVERVKDQQRDARSFAWLEDLRADTAYAARVLLRQPGFAAAAVVTLALGIGASTAIFSVAYGVSLRPLPYPEPDRLIRIYEANPATGQLKHEVGIATFHEWRERAGSITSAALFGKPRTVFLAGAESIPVVQMPVSPAFFDVLGVNPIAGAGFGPEADYTRSTDEVVISFGFWQRVLGGRPDVIGHELAFEGIGMTWTHRIVGVMPEGFAFDQPVDLWMPSLVVQLPISRVFREWRFDRVVARLHPGATIAQAQAELALVAERLAAEFPATHQGWTVTVESLHDAIVGNFGRASWLLLAAVFVVLLVACLNVGGLLVARAIARQREMAVRAALGAGAWRLLRLSLAESSVLGMLGGALGWLVAAWGVAALKAAAPPGIPRIDALDLPVLAVALGSALAAIIISAVAPPGMGGKRDLAHSLRAGSPAAGDGPSRYAARHLLTVAQCAGAAVLVVLAVMLSRSFVNLTQVDLGWQPAGVLSLNVQPPTPMGLRRPWAHYVAWSDRLIAALEATPGIERAAITSQIPLAPLNHPATIARGRGTAEGDPARWPGVSHTVSDGYFDTMGIRLVSGRGFGPRDRFTPEQLINSSTWTQGVAVVTETTARTLWPGLPAVGQALWLPDNESGRWREVVGVVEDIRFHAVAETPGIHVFTPWTQYPMGNPRLVVKGTSTGASIAGVVRQVIDAVDSGARIDQVAGLDALVARATAQPRFTSRLVALFGGLALLLASIGIYGTLSSLVRAGTREIGVRLALGASPGDILARTLGRGLLPALAGGVIGFTAAVAIARAFHAVFFGVAPVDPQSMLLGSALLVLCAAVAAMGPARRASRVDPATTLRAE